MHKNILFASLILVFAGVIACHKDPVPAKPVEKDCQFMESKFYFTDGSWYKETYTFNAGGYLTSVVDTRQDGGFMSRQEYVYENDRLVAEHLYGLAGKVAEYKFHYNGALLTKMQYFETRAQGNDPLIYERTFEYADNQVVRTSDTNYHFQYATYNVLSYKGQNISRIKTYKTSNNELTDDVELEYDNKRNPFSQFFPHQQGMARYDSPNNAVKMKEHLRNGHPSGEIYTSTFTYNANGYPVEQVNTYNEQNIHEHTYTYDCK